MRKTIKKMFLGNAAYAAPAAVSPFRKRIANIRAIWNNDHEDDMGIEKIIRLLLASSQLLFPGIYIRNIAARRGMAWPELAIDFYILCKVAFPLVILANRWQHNQFAVTIMGYLLLETILYIPALIFASDQFSRPRSYRRSMLLIFFNYLEIGFAFAVLYAHGNYLNKPVDTMVDAIYFSIITSSSVGYGDLYPVTDTGKMLVCFQAILFLFFVILFLNFFSNKVKSKGYFDHENQD